MKKIYGVHVVRGKVDRRSGIDAAGWLRYCGGGQQTDVRLMRPCRVSVPMVMASAQGHVYEWDQCYVLDAGRKASLREWRYNPHINQEVEYAQ